MLRYVPPVYSPITYLPILGNWSGSKWYLFVSIELYRNAPGEPTIRLLSTEALVLTISAGAWSTSLHPRITRQVVGPKGANLQGSVL